MATIDGAPVVIRYLLIDLGVAPALLDALRDDLRILHRRRRAGLIDIDIGINTNDAGTRAMIKIVISPADLPVVTAQFADAVWRVAVLAIRNETQIGQVRTIVRDPAWTANP